MSTDPRTAYLDVGLATASPTRLLTMLWDRLLLDVTLAERGLAAGDLEVANERLQHAQDIVFELRSSLRLDVWDGAPGLAALYVYVEERLVAANVRKDPAITGECRSLLEPLHAAIHEAARTAAGGRATLAATA
jgi:flagellar protein FliS